MSTSAELASKFVAIDMATGAEADFEATFELFDEDDGDLGAFDGQGQIDGVFGVAWEGTGFGKVFFADVGMDEVSIALDGGSGQDSTAQSDSSDGVTFVDVSIDG